jgi:hypothetical protein
MSLVHGVHIATIEEHLAVLYVLTVAPDRDRCYLEAVLDAGRAVAHEILKPLYALYGLRNHDMNGVSAFGHNNVAELENQIIDRATSHRDAILAKHYNHAEILEGTNRK